MCGGRDIWKISVPSAKFCWEPKTALKTKVCFFKNPPLIVYIRSLHTDIKVN